MFDAYGLSSMKFIDQRFASASVPQAIYIHRSVLHDCIIAGITTQPGLVTPVSSFVIAFVCKSPLPS